MMPHKIHRSLSADPVNIVYNPTELNRKITLFWVLVQDFHLSYHNRDLL